MAPAPLPRPSELSDPERWLTEFDIHSRALLAMLRQHHRGPSEARIRVGMDANLRAIGMIEDGCLIARCLVKEGTVIDRA